MRAHIFHWLVAVWFLASAAPAWGQSEQPTQPADAAAEGPVVEQPGKLFEPEVPGFGAVPISQPRRSRPTAGTAVYQQAPQSPTPAAEAAPAQEALPEYAAEPWTEEPVWEGEYGSHVEMPAEMHGQGHAYDGCGCDYCCNPWRFSVDYLSMQPRFGEHDFAIADPNTDSQPDGVFHNIDAARANGLHVNFGRELGDAWDGAIGYTYMVSTNSRFVQAPANGQLWATMAHPNTVNVANTADGRLKFKYHVLDAELGRQLNLTPSLDTRVFGGMRFAWIDHDVSVLYNGGDAVNDQILSPLRFTGYGLRLGGQTSWRLINGWSLFGEASTALLVGTIDTGLFEANNNSTTTIVNITDRQNFGTPVLDVGIGATRVWGPWELRAGYKLTHWFNVLQRRNFADDLHSGKSVVRSSDLMLDGFFVGLGLGR